MSSDAVNANGARHDDGFSLIEVLVALVVLSVGLLGLAALQSTSTQFNASAYRRSQATILAYDMADRVRANRQAALTGAYVSAYPALPTCNGAVAGTVVQQDLGGWRRALACALPNGNGAIEFAATPAADGGILTIRVSWDESRAPAPAAPEEFVMTTGL